MSTELWVAVISLITAVVGVVAALVARRQEVIHRHHQESPKPDPVDATAADADRASELFKAGQLGFDEWQLCTWCGHWAPHRRYTECPHCHEVLFKPDQCMSVFQMKCGHYMPFAVKFCAICGEKASPRRTGRCT